MCIHMEPDIKMIPTPHSKLCYMLWEKSCIGIAPIIWTNQDQIITNTSSKSNLKRIVK